MNQELIHYGIKGMRWGIRKSNNDKTIAYKKELIRNDPNASKKIVKKVDYLDKSIPERLAMETGKSVTQKLVFAAATGKLDKYKNMDSTKLGKEFVLTAINSGVRVTIKTSNAKRAIKKYEGEE